MGFTVSAVALSEALQIITKVAGGVPDEHSFKVYKNKKVMRIIATKSGIMIRQLVKLMEAAEDLSFSINIADIAALCKKRQGNFQFELLKESSKLVFKELKSSYQGEHNSIEPSGIKFEMPEDSAKVFAWKPELFSIIKKSTLTAKANIETYVYLSYKENFLRIGSGDNFHISYVMIPYENKVNFDFVIPIKYFQVFTSVFGGGHEYEVKIYNNHIFASNRKTVLKLPLIEPEDINLSKIEQYITTRLDKPVYSFIVGSANDFTTIMDNLSDVKGKDQRIEVDIVNNKCQLTINHNNGKIKQSIEVDNLSKKSFKLVLDTFYLHDVLKLCENNTLTFKIYQASLVISTIMEDNTYQYVIHLISS